jgi:hypothetical protein
MLQLLVILALMMNSLSVGRACPKQSVCFAFAFGGSTLALYLSLLLLLRLFYMALDEGARVVNN